MQLKLLIESNSLSLNLQGQKLLHNQKLLLATKTLVG